MNTISDRRTGPVTRAAVAAGVAAIAFACGRSADIEIAQDVSVITEVVDATANVGFYADLEIDAEGRPNIAYYDQTNGDLKFASYSPESGSWELQVVDEDGDVGGFADLAFSQTGQPHIVYYDYTNFEIKYAFFNNLEWEVNRVPVPSEMEGFLAFQLSKNDSAFISAISAGQFNLEYMLYDPVSRGLGGIVVDDGTLTTGRGGNINLRVSMNLREVNGEELPVIVYYQASHGLLNLAWAERETPNSPLVFRTRVLDGQLTVNSADVGQWASSWIDMGNREADPDNENVDDDLLHISYFDATNQDLKYANYSWSRDEVLRERVDETGIVGETSSIVIDSRGRPNITYYDSTENDLKLAVRVEDGRWLEYRVDRRGIVGTFSTVRLLNDGRLGVAYRNPAQEALVFSRVRTN